MAIPALIQLPCASKLYSFLTLARKKKKKNLIKIPVFLQKLLNLFGLGVFRGEVLSTRTGRGRTEEKLQTEKLLDLPHARDITDFLFLRQLLARLMTSSVI